MPLPAEIESELTAYANAPGLLRESLAGITPPQLLAPAPPGRWSPLEVVAHLSDFEIVFADRIKRIIAEDDPLLMAGDENRFAQRLACSDRNLETELRLIELLREQVLGILRVQPAEVFARTGRHSTDGPMTLLQLLRRLNDHIPHHVEFIRQKRAGSAAHA